MCYLIIEFSLCLLDRGNMTCQRRPGSLGYEKKDANTYAAWGVDYLKLDSCYTDATPTEVEYSLMRDALNASGRPIFYSLCGRKADDSLVSLCLVYYLFVIGGIGVNDLWPPNVGNSWRTTNDIQDNWASMINNIDLVSSDLHTTHHKISSSPLFRTIIMLR